LPHVEGLEPWAKWLSRFGGSKMVELGQRIFHSGKKCALNRGLENTGGFPIGKEPKL
jgi:hypothetical protein